MSGEAQRQDPSGAQSSNLRKEVAERIGSLIREVRDRRRPREEMMLRNHACWMAKGIGREQYKSDLFKHYIPVARRATERFTVRVTQTLMPSPKFFEVFPGNEYDMAAGRSADSVRIFHEHVLTERVNIRRVINTLARTLFLYDQAILKTGVHVLDAPVEFGAYIGSVKEVWPHMRAVDPFNFYLWPETVSSVDEAVLAFEDVMMPYQEYEQFANRQICDPLTRRDLTKPEWPIHHTQRLQHMGFNEPDGGTGSSRASLDAEGNVRLGPMEAFVAISTAYFKVRGNWWQCWLAWNVPEAPRCVRLHTAPFPYPPYRMGTSRPLPGELYTSGYMDDLEPLQILYNDQVNQGEEARAIVAVPPVIIDPAQVSRADSIKFGPRQRWYGSKDGFEIPNIPDTSVNALRAQQQTLSLLNSIGGAGAVTEGQTQRGMPRAGFAVSQMLSLAMGEIKDAAEVIEQDCMTPALGDMHRWTLAFVPPQQIFMIPGAAEYGPSQITINDLIGNWHFRWVGTLQAQDKEIRAQRLLAAIETLGKVEERLMQQGFMINWPSLVKMAWRDGLGERGVEHIVTPMPPDMAQQFALEKLAELMSGSGMSKNIGPQARAAETKAKAPKNAEEGSRQRSRQATTPNLGPMV